MKARIDTRRAFGLIDRHIYGHFSEHLGRCIYGGYWVGEDEKNIPHKNGIRTDIVGALKEIGTPVVRWPGGCFADDYHWMDGVGPRNERPTIVNMHWGGVTEDNSFGTHEFFELCEQLNCDAYICGNVGSGSVREMRDWIEYITNAGRSPMSDMRVKNGRAQPWKLKYFGVGNETWGCGGNMRAEYYADEYKRYATYIRKYGDEAVEKIAVGPNSGNTHWTEVMMREAGNRMDGLSLHYYTVPNDWKNKGFATGFSADEWERTIAAARVMEDHVKKHAAIMDAYDPERKVSLVVDEWGTWFTVEPDTNPGFLYQQNTLRDALVAGMHLNLFNNFAARVRMANIAQTINVLQAVLLTEGAKMIKTPTFHVFKLFLPHHDAQLLRADSAELSDNMTLSCSRASDGSVAVTICNPSLTEAVPFSIELEGAQYTHVEASGVWDSVRDAHNTFDDPDRLTIKTLDGVKFAANTVSGELPPASVVLLRARQ